MHFRINLQYFFLDTLLFNAIAHKIKPVMTKELLKKLQRDHRSKRLGGIARAMGIPYSTLYRIVEGQSKGSVDTWEKIEAFYEAHEKICLKAGCNGRVIDGPMATD